MNDSATEHDPWQRDVLTQLRGTTDAATAAVPVRVRSAYRSASDVSALAERPRQLYRQISARPALSRTRRWIRGLAGVLRGDEEPSVRSAALERLQSPMATGRRVIVSGAHGGAGATSIALALVEVLHAHRPDGVALVDGAGHAGGLVSRLSTAPTMSVASADRHLESGRIEAVLPPHMRPIRSVLAPAAPDPDVAAQVVRKVQRHVAFTLVDAGAGPGADGARRVETDIGDAGRSGRRPPSTAADCLVVVAENTVRGLLCVQASIRQHVAGGASAERILVVIVQRVADSGVTAAAARREVQRIHDVPVVVVPRDRHLAGGAQLRTELLAPSTTTVLMQIAAEVVWRSGGLS